FPEVHLTPKDLSSSWAGLRPLIFEEDKSASEMSRKDEFFFSANGLISIAGGKLTGYRKMAERTVDVVIEKLEEEGLLSKELKDCFSDKIALGSHPFKDMADVSETKRIISEKLSGHFGKSSQLADYLVSNYGKETYVLLEKIASAVPTYEDLLKAEMEFTIDNELTLLPLDFINRRTGRLYFNLEQTLPYIDFILSFFAEKFTWDTDKLADQKEAVWQAINDARVL
ncbi:MAG: glycerol-3-phosphate dehydrogenase, partial [Saprospiraceae bacterium]|nr:glycerol-3-phosphate dehydrogenase [Saprospiraceae bacterium]